MAAGLPSHGVGELQGAAHHQRLRALRRQVHLDDLRQGRTRTESVSDGVNHFSSHRQTLPICIQVLVEAKQTCRPQ